MILHYKLSYLNFRTELTKFCRLDGLDVGIDHRHDGGRFDDAVRCFEASEPACDVFVGYFEDWGHDNLIMKEWYIKMS